jgi:hypothetical protein
MSLGSTNTTIAGLTSVSSTGFTGILLDFTWLYVGGAQG